MRKIIRFVVFLYVLIMAVLYAITGELEGVKFDLVSADFLNFKLLKLD